MLLVSVVVTSSSVFVLLALCQVIIGKLLDDCNEWFLVKIFKQTNRKETIDKNQIQHAIAYIFLHKLQKSYIMLEAKDILLKADLI